MKTLGPGDQPQRETPTRYRDGSYKPFKELIQWQKDYIEAWANPCDTRNSLQLEKDLGVVRQTLWQFRKNYVPFWDIVEQKAATYRSQLGNSAMKRLHVAMNKGNVKAIEIALEIAGKYVKKQEIEEKFTNKEDAIRFVKSKLTSFTNHSGDYE